MPGRCPMTTAASSAMTISGSRVTRKVIATSRTVALQRAATTIFASTNSPIATAAHASVPWPPVGGVSMPHSRTSVDHETAS